MDPRELVLAALRHDDLSARQLVKDGKEEGFVWAEAPALDFVEPNARAVYAGLVELFAEREGLTPPAWTAEVGAAQTPVYLAKDAQTSKAVRQVVERDSPAPLKKRSVFAFGQYLDVL
jgi:hypothetical protein